MSSEAAVIEIADCAVCDITQRFTGIKPIQTPSVPPSDREGHSFVIRTTRSYVLVIALQASDSFLRMTAEHMKRGPISSDEEVTAYTREFFNILCGHIVTAVNNRIRSRAIFGIPEVFSGAFQEPAHPSNLDSCAIHYDTANGPLSLRLYYDDELKNIG